MSHWIHKKQIVQDWNKLVLVCQVNAARGQCWVDVGFWGGVIPGNAPSLKVKFMI